MKRLLTLLCSLCMLCTGAWAQAFYLKNGSQYVGIDGNLSVVASGSKKPVSFVASNGNFTATIGNIVGDTDYIHLGSSDWSKGTVSTLGLYKVDGSKAKKVTTLEAGGEYLIVAEYNSQTYAMNAENNSSTGESRRLTKTEVTITNGIIKSGIADNMKWTTEVASTNVLRACDSENHLTHVYKLHNRADNGNYWLTSTTGSSASGSRANGGCFAFVKAEGTDNFYIYSIWKRQWLTYDKTAVANGKNKITFSDSKGNYFKMEYGTSTSTANGVWGDKTGFIIRAYNSSNTVTNQCLNWWQGATSNEYQSTGTIGYWSDKFGDAGCVWVLEEEPYYVNFPNNQTKTDDNRKITKVVLGSDEKDITTAGQVYYDMTSSVTFHVSAGQSNIVPQIHINGGNWMHGMVYLDINQDRQFSIHDAEMVGNTALEGNPDRPLTCSAFTAPTVPGTYRMRFKTDWVGGVEQGKDPAGRLGGDNQKGAVTESNGIAANRGNIIDVTLIVDPLPDTEVSLVYKFKNGDNIATKRVVATKGEAYPTFTTPYGVNITNPLTGNVPDDAEDEQEVIIEYTLNNDYPFIPSTSFNDATWYYWKQRKSNETGKVGYIYYDSARTSNGMPKTATNGAGNTYKWAFIGNPFDGYKIANKAKGEGSYLALTAETGDDKLNWSSTGSPFELNVMTPSSNQSEASLVAGDAVKAYFKLKGSTSNSLHDLSNVLNNWTGSGSVTDGGSVVGFEIATVDAEFLSKKANALVTISSSSVLYGDPATEGTAAYTAASTINGIQYNAQSEESVAEAVRQLEAAMEIFYASANDKVIMLESKTASNKYMIATKGTADPGTQLAANDKDGSSAFRLEYVEDSNGQYKLYNLAAESYILRTPGESQRIQMGAEAGTYTLYPWPEVTDNAVAFVSTNPQHATHNSLHRNNSSNIVAWKADTSSESSFWIIHESDITEEAINSAKSTIETARRQAALDALNTYKSTITPFVGEGLGHYTANEAYTEALANAETMSTSNTADEINSAKTNLETAFDALPINIPTTGKYYRIKGAKSDKYMDADVTVTASNRTNFVGMSDRESNVSTIFYLDENNHLKPIKQDWYIKSTCEKNGTLDNAATFSFSRASKQYAEAYGRYHIQSPNYLYDNGASYNSVDRNGTTAHANTENWIITEVPEDELPYSVTITYVSNTGHTWNVVDDLLQTGDNLQDYMDNYQYFDVDFYTNFRFAEGTDPIVSPTNKNFTINCDEDFPFEVGKLCRIQSVGTSGKDKDYYAGEKNGTWNAWVDFIYNNSTPPAMGANANLWVFELKDGEHDIFAVKNYATGRYITMYQSTVDLSETKQEATNITSYYRIRKNTSSDSRNVDGVFCLQRTDYPSVCISLHSNAQQIGIWTAGNNEETALGNIDNGLRVLAPESFTATLNSIENDGYYGTIYSDLNMTMPEGVKAYRATLNGEALHLDEVTGELPAGAYVLYQPAPEVSTGAKTTAAITMSDPTPANEENVLTGTLEEGKPFPSELRYALSGKNGIGFYKYNPNTYPVAKAVYIPAEPTQVAAFYFDFGNPVVTAIQELQKEHQEQGTIFDLQGRRIQKAQKGMNIINGRKVLR